MGPQEPLVGHLDLAVQHRLDDRRRQHPRPVRRRTPVHEQPGEPGDIGRRRADPAVRAGRAGQHVPQRRGHRLLARVGHVPHGGPEAQHLLRQGHGVLQPERAGQQFPERFVPRAAGHDLDDSAEDVVRGAGVGDRRPGRVGESDRPRPLDVAGQAVVPAAGVVDVVALDAAGVVEELTRRDGPARLLVGDRELGQDVDHRGVEVQLSGLREQHHHRGGVALADGADLEHGVGGHGDAGLRVQDAGGQFVDLTVGEHGQGGAVDAVGGEQFVESGLPADGVEGRCLLGHAQRAVDRAGDVPLRPLQELGHLLVDDLGQFAAQAFRHVLSLVVTTVRCGSGGRGRARAPISPAGRAVNSPVAYGTRPRPRRGPMLPITTLARSRAFSNAV